jgi:aryl-alcohol dehydrogenase-like predicted oxidoreductase
LRYLPGRVDSVPQVGEEVTMQSVRLGDTPLAVSRMCLGTMYFGTLVAEPAAYAVLDRYAEAGGTFLDTANNYAYWVAGGTGDESETLVGRWLADRAARDRVVLATKIGARPAVGNGSPAGVRGLSARAVAEQVEGSLRRLGTDRIDLLYTHIHDRHTPIAETLHALTDLVAAGKVRAIAASNLTRPQLAEATETSQLHGLARYRALQQRYTYLEPLPTADFAPQVLLDDQLRVYCADQHIVPLAYSVLLGGAYTRADRPLPAAYQTDRAPRQLATLRAVADDLRVSPNTVVYSWLLAAGIVPVIGASDPEQLAEALAADRLPLPDGSLALLETARSA